MNKTILLINPPTGRYNREDRCQVSVDYQMIPAPRPPIDLAYLAAIGELYGYSCQILDMPVAHLSWSYLQNTLSSLTPCKLIISSTHATFHKDILAARMCREVSPTTEIILKAPYYGYQIERIVAQQPDIDVCLGNEYERAFMVYCATGAWENVPGVAFRKNGNIQRTEEAKELLALEQIPFPARHLLNNNSYRRPDTNQPQTTIMVSRGCPYRCIYCLSNSYTTTHYQLRKPSHIIEEVRECIERFTIHEFFFKADTFTLDHAWVEELCGLLLSEKRNVSWVCNSRTDTFSESLGRLMKSSGCWGVAFGVESSNANTLKRMGKACLPESAFSAISICRELGLLSLAYFMIGLPWETRSDILHTIDFAIKLGADLTEFHIALPFPGTPLFQTARHLGLLASDTLPAGYDFAIPAIDTQYVSKETVYRLKKYALWRFYSRPVALLRLLKHFHNPAILFRLAFYAGKKCLSILTRSLKNESSL